MKNIDNKGIIYQIPCKGCDRSYYGESGRDVSTRINEHKRDLRAHRTSNSLVMHVDEQGHLPDWDGAKVLHKGLGKGERKLTEAAYICSNRSTNHREGFYRIANGTAEKILEEVRRDAVGIVSQPETRRGSASVSRHGRTARGCTDPPTHQDAWGG